MENFFLDYANNSFRKNVENLRIAIGLASRNDGFVQEDIDVFDEVTETIIQIVKGGDSARGGTGPLVAKKAKNIAYENRNDLIKILKKGILKEWVNTQVFKYALAVYDMAYQSVYGHELLRGKGIRCDENWRKNTLEVLGEESFNGPNKLKCYECDQLYLVHVLREIIRGREYDEINNLEYMLWITNEHVVYHGDIEISVNKSKKKSPFRTALIREMGVRFPINLLMEARDFFTDFGQFPSYRVSLLGGAIYSLFEFLNKNDRRKLKFCDKCNKFFISKTIRSSKFCSEKCRLSWHNRRRIESGEHREYKRRKRKDGAKESYYG
jgi:hypothetical protein